MQVNDSFIIPWCFTRDDCTATVFYKSEQVLRFRLSYQSKIMEVKKRLLIKSRQPWKILKVNFEFTGDEDGRLLSRLFWHLDDTIKAKPRYDRSSKN